MTSSLYERRVEQEWLLLESLALTNPDLLAVEGRRDDAGVQAFAFRLARTPALVMESSEIRHVDCHRIRIRFPRFFPSVLAEPHLASAVFHPNVHPENGFVCLWDRFSSRYTVFQVVAQLQRVLTWQLFNESPDHVLQPLALAWYRSIDRGVTLPLNCAPVRLSSGYEDRVPALPHLRRRNRLSAL